MKQLIDKALLSTFCASKTASNRDRGNKFIKLLTPWAQHGLRHGTLLASAKS
ncbi:hypothetical protein [Bradyrhizobium yuanmingense]|uniref:hypothetical protein n=1 Tax=Bradyrhizobium yuanmingense TaxID=108015 RepID=UPI0035182110